MKIILILYLNTYFVPNYSLKYLIFYTPFFLTNKKLKAVCNLPLIVDLQYFDNEFYHYVNIGIGKKILLPIFLLFISLVTKKYFVIKLNYLYIDRKIVPMRIKIFQLFFLSVFILHFSPKITFGQGVLDISDSSTYPVSEYLSVLEAHPSEGISYVVNRYKAGAFQTIHTERPFNPGATSNIWWFALPVRNVFDQTNRVIFTAASSSAAYITLYEELDGVFVPIDTTGYAVPAAARTLDTRLFSFELKLRPQEEKIYFISVDTRGGNLYVPFYLDAPNDYWSYETDRALLYGLFAGIFFLAFLISVFFWARSWESIYLYYSLYIVLSFFMIMEEDGYTSWWIYGNFYPQLSMIIIPFAGTLGMVFMVQIMLAFHGFTRKNYIIHSFAKISQGILVLLAITNLLFLWIPFPYEFRSIIYNLSFVGIIIGSFTALGGSIVKLIEGFKPARLYLLAISVMTIGLLNYSMNFLAITNYNIIQPNGIVVGITLEVIIMIFALAYRFNELKKEREKLLITLNKERMAVSDQILQTLENERERLAKDLHDDLGGLLALIKMQLSQLAYKTTPYQSELSETYMLVSKACNDLRAISHDLILEGQETRDLCSMINEIIRYYQKSSDLQFHTYYKNIPPLDLNTKITLFRMLKELIQNVAKHAKASECNIQMIYDRKVLRIMVEDNGVGFDYNSNTSLRDEGIGLTNIQSRVDFLKGELHVESNFTGTTFILEIPITQEVNQMA